MNNFIEIVPWILLNFIKLYRGFVIESKIIAIHISSISLPRLLVKFCHNHNCTSKYLRSCITTMSNPKKDPLHASNPNENPTYILCTYICYIR